MYVCMCLRACSCVVGLTTLRDNRSTGMTRGTTNAPEKGFSKIESSDSWCHTDQISTKRQHAYVNTSSLAWKLATNPLIPRDTLRLVLPCSRRAASCSVIQLFIHPAATPRVEQQHPKEYRPGHLPCFVYRKSDEKNLARDQARWLIK